MHNNNNNNKLWNKKNADANEENKNILKARIGYPINAWVVVYKSKYIIKDRCFYPVVWPHGFSSTIRFLFCYLFIYLFERREIKRRWPEPAEESGLCGATSFFSRIESRRRRSNEKKWVIVIWYEIYCNGDVARTYPFGLSFRVSVAQNQMLDEEALSVSYEWDFWLAKAAETWRRRYNVAWRSRNELWWKIVARPASPSRFVETNERRCLFWGRTELSSEWEKPSVSNKKNTTDRLKSFGMHFGHGFNGNRLWVCETKQKK